MAELKPGWQWVKFGDVVRLNKETCRDPESAGIERVIGLEHLEPGDLRVRSWADVADGTTFSNRVRPGQVLFGKRRAYQRKVAVADFDAICSGDIYVLETADPTQLLQDLLPYICQADSFFEFAVGTSAGSLSPRTNWKSLAAYEFALPPLEEQRRLAAVLGALVAVRERGLELRSQASLAVTAAVDGHVADVADTIIGVSQLVARRILCPPQDGNHGARHPKASDYTPSGVPFLMASDVRNGIVDLASCKHLSQGLADSLRPKFRALPGDVLLTHKGTVGEVARLGPLPTAYAMLTPQVTYYRVLDEERLDPRYLAMVLCASSVRQQLVSLGRQSTRAFVSITTQLNLRVPCPPLERQHALVDTVSALHACSEQIAKRSEIGKAIARILSAELSS